MNMVKIANSKVSKSFLEAVVSELLKTTGIKPDSETKNYMERFTIAEDKSRVQFEIDDVLYKLDIGLYRYPDANEKALKDAEKAVANAKKRKEANEKAEREALEKLEQLKKMA
jgi:hypothetical protein